MNSGPLAISCLLSYTTISGECGFLTTISKDCEYIHKAEYAFAIGSTI
jgi:hypothetical protein